MKLLFAPPYIKKVAKLLDAPRPKILDVGCGFGAPHKLKAYLPDCEYHGLDRDERSLLPGDAAAMHAFYAADLESSDLAEIPDGYFDAILMSHVIEHLRTGQECLRRLASKLKARGVLYVEYPGVRSLRAPRASRGGFLHFHDDPTHVRLYSVTELANVLLASDCHIVSAGTRRDPVRLVLSPLLALRGLIQRKSLWSGRLWDLFGIAEFVIARRIDHHGARGEASRPAGAPQHTPH